MSAPIKRSIGLTKNRLQRYLTQTNNLLGQVEHESPEAFISHLRHLHERISTTVTQLENINDKWIDYINDLDIADQDEANKAYDEYTSIEDNFMTVLDNSKDLLYTINETIDKESAHLNRTSGIHTLDGSTSHGELFGQIHTSALPKIHLPRFNGNPLTWNTFWQSFAPLVTNQPFPPVHKMQYLKNCLEGEPLDELRDYQPSNENYLHAIEILHTQYGNKQQLIEKLHTELITLPKCNASTQSLKSFCQAIDRICRQLQSLHEPDDTPFLTTTVKAKLPESIITKLNELHGTSTEPYNTPFIRTSLRNIISWRADLDKASPIANSDHTQPTATRSPQHKDSSKSYNNKSRNMEHTRNFAVTTPTHSRNPNTKSLRQPTKRCFLCNDGYHWINDCKRFASREERLQRLKELRKCFRCLQEGHMASECRNNRVCFNCKGKHHQILCNKGSITTLEIKNTERTNVSPPTYTKKQPKVNTVTLTTTDTPTENIVVNTNTSLQPFETLLMVKKVKITSEERPFETYDATVFFDSGSQTSFINSELAQRIKLKTITDGEIEVYTFNGQKPMRFNSPKHVIHVVLENRNTQTLVVNRTEHIAAELKTVTTTRTQFEHDIKHNSKNVKPDILIGIGDFWSFFKKVVKLNQDLYVIHTTVGKSLCGKTDSAIQLTKITVNSINGVTEFSPAYEDEITKFWDLQHIGITDDENQNDDEVALEHFNKTVQQVNGRYRVKWPWKDQNPNLPNNFYICYYRLKSTLKQLKASPDLLTKYDTVFKEQLEKDIIEIAPHYTEGLEHFLPHQPVIRLYKMNTKLRVVFDASAHQKGKFSLNNCLYRGPVLLPDLAGLLLRFRLAPIVILADIEKAFLMIELDEPDRNVTKFLWVKDVEKLPEGDNLVVYRFQRVTFGIISSPFLLAATVRHHLHKYEEEIAREIESNIYVDNILMTATTESEALHKYKESKRIFSEAKMNLREFLTNCDEVNMKIPEEDRLVKGNPKVLGLQWNTKKDILQLKLLPKQKEDTKGLSRRTVLQELASTFDPLGLIAPTILEAKLFFQSLWEDKREWDTPLTREELRFWNQFREERANQIIEIPRLILTGQGHQLHVFVDASQNAYAAVVYLRTESNTNATVQLIYSKNRLRPHKGMSIPRLELMAILIGVRILKFVKRELRLPIEKEFLWSDSQCALSWIANTEDKSRFVTNRLMEIRQHDHVSFNFVPTSENPADVSTRGSTIQDLRDNRQWWNGPQWLDNYDTCWPTILQVHPPAEKETKEKNMITLSIVQHSEEKPRLIKLERFRSWKIAVNTMRYCLQFINSKLGQREQFSWYHKDAKISFDRAETILLKTVQKEFAFSPDQLNKWKIYVDELGIQRVKTRMNPHIASNDFANPILLHHKHAATKLLMLQSHQEVQHMGIGSTLTQFLTRFWIPNARRTAKEIVHQCMKCRRYQAQPFKLPPMPGLPASRITRSRAFEHVGIDYFGPTLIRMTDQTKKIWIMIITCLSTRAIHLDVINDLSTQTFLNSLRRFIARRGRPSTILSDNGKCFVLGAKVLTDAWKQITQSEALNEYLDQQKIQWKFIPELSPWQGGVYERLVALVKNCFKRAVGKHVLPLDQFSTFLTEVETILNQRPLTYVDTEADGFLPLRPIDFIQPHIQTDIPIPSQDEDIIDWIHTIDNRESLLRMWNSSLKILDSFWERWQTEYLTQLRHRNQTEHRGPHWQTKLFPRIGQVVIIHQELTPRNLWKLGRIIEVPDCQQDLIKNVKLKTANGRVISRPICKLYPLEVETLEDQNEEKTQKTIAIHQPAETEDNTVLQNEKKNQDNITKDDKVDSKGYNLRNRAHKQPGFYTLMIISIILSWLWTACYGTPTKITRQCAKCYAKCTPHGVSISLPSYIEKTEVCCNTEDCQEFEGHKKVRVSLREDTLLNKYQSSSLTNTRRNDKKFHPYRLPSLERLRTNGMLFL